MYRLLFYSSQRGIVGPGTTARPSYFRLALTQLTAFIRPRKFKPPFFVIDRHPRLGFFSANNLQTTDKDATRDCRHTNSISSLSHCIALHCIAFLSFDTCIPLFFKPFTTANIPGFMAFGSKMEAHERHLAFCLFFFHSLSPLLRRDNSMLLLLLLPHRWMIGCDDIYTTGRLFSFWHYS